MIAQTPLSDDAGLLHARGVDLLLRIADDIKAPEEYSSPYVGQGSVLNAILLQEAATARGREADVHRAAAHLRHAMTLLDAMPLSSSLYRGVTGLGWALETFAAPDLLPERDEILQDLDDLLVEGLETTANHNIDIIHGVAGIGVYALARGARSASSRALWHALDVIVTEYCRSWRPGSYGGGNSTGDNLGLAHGPAGLMAVGSVAHARGLLSAESASSLRMAYETLWSVAREKDGIYWYPTSQSLETPSRLAWCYGSLGLAATFKQGIGLDPENAWRLERMVESSLVQYEAGRHGIRDASLCHGEAGVTLSLEYLARGASLQPDLRHRLHAAAIGAGNAALDAERGELGVGAFLHSTAKGMVPYKSFLEGGPGVALAIASSYAPSPRPWMQLIGYFG